MIRRTIRYITLLLGISASLQAQTPAVVNRIILIGDAGELHDNDRNPVVDAVRQQFDLKDSKNTILFLGDNVYPRGLPDSTSRSYPVARGILDYQINLVRGTAAKGFIIPGNHDWDKSKPDGWQVIRNQQQYVDSQHLDNVTFLPKDGCPGPVEVKLADNITLIIMDSEWWVFPYEKPGVESSCDCKDKDEILSRLKEIVALNRNKLIIFASHHPFRSYGIHGGYYTAKQHLFPLTDLRPWLYVPLPVIGSIYPIARGVFGTAEDLPNPKYQQMVKGVEAALQAHGPVVYVSGHDHTLQLIKDAQNAYVISGSGAKNNRVRRGPKSLFATAGSGFSVLEVMSDSTVRVQYYLADQPGQPVFTNTLLHLRDLPQQGLTYTMPAALPPYMVMAPDSQYNHVNNFHRFLLGNNYRDVWATPLKFPVLNLHTAKGGLKILQRGGGKQTRSLRLEDSTGTEYAMRSLKKYPLAAIPEILRETVAREVVQDQISGANPYAPLAVSVLAEAAGVPHTHPTFVYMPVDTALGVYATDFGHDVYLFEEREPKTGSNDKTYNTPKVLKKLWGDNDVEIDQKSVLRARIFDMYIMDFDRHDDQWRWYREKHKGREIYYPVPRDRDQAFFLNEGLLPRAVSRPWLIPGIQGFRDYIPDINGFNFSSRYFDRSFLHELDEKDWKKQTDKFLGRMTDSVIQAAVKAFPDTIQSLVGPMMVHRLSVRRNILEKNVMKYYRFLARGVDVPATEKNELISLEKQAGGKVALNIFKISKKGEVQQNIYSRTFDPSDTKVLNVYGLGGNDRFEIKGNHGTPIRIRLIGGKDRDTYIDSTTVKAGKRIRVYDQQSGKDSFALTRNEQRRLSDNPENISYKRDAFKYEKTMPLIAGAYNRDDGLLLGVGLQLIRHSFRKEPFAAKHLFTATHSLATRAWNFKYTGELTDVIGKSDLLLLANAKAPNNTINFFGFGNETVFDKSGNKTISYYRARFNLYSAEALLRTSFGRHVSIAYGPLINHYAFNKDENGGRYITNFQQNKLDSANTFRNKYYAGAKIAVQFDTRDNKIIPTRGIFWNTTWTGNKGLSGDSRNFMQLQSDLSLYMSFRIPANFVIVSRFGGGKIWGDYEYFQALTVGGTQNLRGYRNYRFAGNAAVYNNTEIRVKLFDLKTYILPAGVGIVAFNDIGRVWQDNETSHVWHDGYGGGLYLAPVNTFIITAVVGHSKEETIPYVTLGFKF
ncbi:BamA/TamA family outer membrane protein [Chitinophaga nivalis]|uniref:BamA/TamA family outer membrane protein n=1 Tax=Chitinophaga nivalis TaxID=2991709 RepID=A0ABT3IWX5_9BACT|nr:BamA/TamA family outer membrane protein [Chitinophaga nivalis]MCW3461824.1 BamA/TamA family outer membrane protein [Chitinophaga nivalis]MCW3488482.1 BamA/TamA family outer membrane protein [Chitinophaga nivalis]